jgi:hypothetical protein
LTIQFDRRSGLLGLLNSLDGFLLFSQQPMAELCRFFITEALAYQRSNRVGMREERSKIGGLAAERLRSEWRMRP